MHESLFDLTGRVVLITGGYGHLGRGIVRGLRAHGATVVVLGRDAAKFQEVFSAEIPGGQLHFVACDIAHTDSVRAAFASSQAAYGPPAVLINNATYSAGSRPDQLTDAEFATGLDGSLGSTYRCLRESLPYFRARGGGNIINVASMYGVVAPEFAAYADHPQFINPPHYGAAKAGVVQLTKYFASYLGPENIRVNCVSPGAFPSAGVRAETGFVAALTQRIPLGRIGEPQDLAGAFVFLSSAASSFMTGHNLVVDGGWTIK